MSSHIGDFIAMLSFNERNIATETGRLSWPNGYDKQTKVQISTAISGPFSVATIGHTVLENHSDDISLGLYHMPTSASERQAHQQLSAALLSNGTPGPEALTGKFLTVVYSADDQSIKICTDHMRSSPLYYAETQQGFLFASDCLLLAKFAGIKDVDERAIYHYLNFSYVPTPYSIFKGISKLPPGSLLSYARGKKGLHRFWQPTYDGTYNGSQAEAVSSLRESLSGSIQRHLPEGQHWGTFLSGGNDSSTITGVLAAYCTGVPVRSFSIGFEEQGYDELPFARAAAKHFETRSHTLSVSASDTLNCMDTLVDMYDEPFGNSSAIPTYFCAALAAEHGIDTLIAGDGGDEIFGGNERYAKDAIFRKFFALPSPLKSIFRGSAQLLKPIDIRILNRVHNFVHRASLANPERFYVDDSFASDFFEELLSDAMQTTVNRDSSLELVEEHYKDCGSDSDLHRLMYIDLQMAIADNDLMKVNKTAKASGVSVLYPFLDRQLVDFTGTLPARYKVNGQQKRFLFRQAVENILPDEILNKKKQGFGLPVSVWFREHPQFRELVHDVLLSSRASGRGYFNQKLITQLVSRHEKNAWDYSSELWMLIILELWFRRNIDE